MFNMTGLYWSSVNIFWKQAVKLLKTRVPSLWLEEIFVKNLFHLFILGKMFDSNVQD